MDGKSPAPKYIFLDPNTDPRAVERTLRRLILERLSSAPEPPPPERGADRP